MGTYSEAYNNDTLNNVIGNLLECYIDNENETILNRLKGYQTAGWLATLLANSAHGKHRRKAMLFAALSQIVLPPSSKVETLCYTIFSRTGALPAARHLNQVVGDSQQYSGPSLGPLSLEFLAAFTESYSDLAGGAVLTKFQKDTEESLSLKPFGILSAPTSAGKSFIVHEHIKQQLAKRNGFIALFIVPTKALIAQTSAIYRRYSAESGLDYSIYTSITDDLEIPTDNAILALTQERCIRLLSSPIAKDLSFIFIDEIQELESGERGALLEYVIHEFRNISTKASMFAAGPYIANVKQLGASLFSEDCQNIETKDSPVSQILMQVTPVKDKKELRLSFIDQSKRNNDYKFTISTDRKLYSKWKGSQTKAISDAIKIFSTDSPSIVYSPGKGTAENWAKHHINQLPDKEVISSLVVELIDYLKESIHPKCSLIRCLKKGVAYHHAGLPDFVRDEIEELFIQREIDTLFCTPTLLEGVNLPADKIFIVSPQKGDDPLTLFDFKNLSGRAGRLNEHLCGVVYCVQPPNDEKEWIENYRSEQLKEVEPTVDTKLTNSFSQLEEILSSGEPVYSEEDDFGLRGTVTILRSRYLREKKLVQDYLEKKSISSSEQEALVTALDNTMQSQEIPAELALKNPYIDPILQNSLYQVFMDSPEDWAIRSQRGFATDFKNVFKQLDKIFHIIKEIKPIGIEEYYRNDLLSYSKKWLRGEAFRKLVDRAIPKKKRDLKQVTDKDVDTAIIKVMNIITTDIAFVTAKYFSVLSDIVKHVVPEKEQEPFVMTLGLPAMLELGCSDPKALTLVTACVPRGAAIKLAPIIPDDEDPLAWLAVNQENKKLKELPSIYHKILQRIGIWKQERQE